MGDISDRLAQELANDAYSLERVATPPSIPTPQATIESLLATVRAIKQLLDLREGRASSVLEKAVTFRDLRGEGIAEVSSSGSLIPGIPVIMPDGFYADARPYLTVPPTPTNLEAAGGFNSVILTWDLLNYQNHAYVEIWRSTTNNLGTAVAVGQTTSNLHSDDLGGSAASFYYWVRAVNNEGTEGPFNAGSSGGTLAGRGIVGNVDLGPLIVEADNIASGAITLPKFSSGVFASIGGQNMVRNSSFEADANADGTCDNWTAYSGGSTGTVSRERVSSGRRNGFAQRVSAAALGATTSDRAGVLQDIDAAALAGMPISASFYVYSVTGSPKIVGYIDARDSGGSVVGIESIGTTPVDATWTRVFIPTFSMPATAVSLRLHLWMQERPSGPAYSSVIFDDAQVEVSEVHTAYAPRPDEILAGTITSTEISDNAVTTPKLVAGAVVAGKIAADAVTATNIAASAVTADKIAADAVVAGKIAAGAIAVGSAAIANGAIRNAQIENLAVDSAKIANGAIVTAKIGDAQITTAKIADLQVTDAKIANITAAKIDTRGLTIRDANNVVIFGSGSVVGNDTAASLGLNPTFSAWSGTYPDAWASWAGAAPARNTGNAIGSPYCVQWTVNASEVGMQITVSFPAPLPAGTYVSGSFNMNILTNAGGGSPGYLFRLYTNSALSTYVDTFVPMTNKTVTGWQRMPFVAGANGSAVHGITVFQMAAWGSAPGGSLAVGSVILYGPLGFTVHNPITSANASTFIADAAIGNAQIGGTIRSTSFNGTVDGSGNITDYGTAGWAISKPGGMVVDAIFVRHQKISQGRNSALIHSTGSAVNSASATVGFISGFVSGGFVAEVACQGYMDLYLDTSSAVTAAVTFRLVATNGTTTLYSDYVEDRRQLEGGIPHAPVSGSYRYMFPFSMSWLYGGDYWVSYQRLPGISGLPLTPSSVSNKLTAGTWTISVEMSALTYTPGTATLVASMLYVRGNVSGYINEFQGSRPYDVPASLYSA